MEEKDYLYYSFLGKRCIKYMFKQYLYHLEDLLDKKSISIDDYEEARQRILDIGNDQARFFEDQAGNYFKINR
tara:strand:+ start:4338 stop:4556 length:219 start_codon:yes stop_codon:yes gene_type:complete